MSSRALDVLILLVFGVPACAFGVDRVEVRLVVTADAEAPHREGELDLFVPRFTSCEHCVEMKLVTPSGEAVLVEAEREPRLVFAESDIEEVRLTEWRSVIDPSLRSWVAIAVPGKEARSRMAEVSAMFPFDSVLVTLDGTSIDVHNIASWSTGLRLGVFGKRAALEKFAEKLEIPKVWVPFDEDEFKKARQEVLDAMEHGSTSP